MSEDNKTIRLSKVVKEFNVGINTIVEFLRKKGIELDGNPNTKISPETFIILQKEFSSEISAKKESAELSLRAQAEKNAYEYNDDKYENENENESESEKEEIKEVPAKPAKVPDNELINEIKKEEIKGPKILGKIDLDANKKKHKIEPKEAKTESIKIPKKEIKEKKEKKSIEAEENIIKKEDTQLIQEIEVIAPEIISKEEVKEEIKEVTKEQEIIKEKIVTEPETYEVEKTKIEDNIKIIDKIDLSAINQKTRPTKKTKEEKEVERKEKADTKAKLQKEKDIQKQIVLEKKREGENTHKIETKDENRSKNAFKPIIKEESKVFKPQIEKLSGPTVIGKIKLSIKTDGPNKEAGFSEDDKFRKKKKKRKRILKDKFSEPNKFELLEANGDESGKSKKISKTRKQPLKIEISEEDVQQQIKDTLALLTTKTKSKAAKYRREKRDAISHKLQEEVDKIEKEKNILKVTEFVSVNELATMMNVPVNQVIGTCMNLGLLVSINQRLDAETMSIVADEFNFKVEFVSVEVQDAIKDEVEDKPEDLIPRPPIVTVMGHVDHGKTKLLDHIRHTNAIAGEIGGITQHIGAYNVTLDDGKQITFLDTPGHEAFTAMRARGAQVTDVAIIVIAADDGVMPQTVEAINHAHAAGVPIVFAINKIDKEGSNGDKIREKLSKMNFLVEEWGGKYQSQEISAKQGLNVDLLLDKVLLEAEMLDLKANPNKKAYGTVIESSLDKGRGYVATILVKAGTLKVGDIILAGACMGRVKAMYNERNQKLIEAGPSTPVLILGLDGAPQAGDNFNVMDNERDAKEIANKRIQLQREQGFRTQKHITLDEIGRRIAIGNFQELNIIVKGDVDGSIEALSDSLIKLSNQEIQVNVIHKAVGQISESDVMLAAASNAIIIGFQVRPSVNARKLAEREEIDIRLYSIIYDAINELKDAMEGMLSPEIKEEIMGTAEIREVFKITKVGTIAGCIMTDGKITRNTKVRLIREGIVVYSGELGSLKRFKDDAKEVTSGQECGLNIDKFNDIKVGDIIEGYQETEVRKKL